MFHMGCLTVNGAQLGQRSIESATALNDIKLELSAKRPRKGDWIRTANWLNREFATPCTAAAFKATA